METHLRRSNEGSGGGGGNDGLTRDFLGLRTISHRGFPNMAGLDHMNSPSSSYDQQNQNQTPWQGDGSIALDMLTRKILEMGMESKRG
ncbi:hypothetical protein CsSME_00037115 [Camellia sinensis var. sinensis]